MLNLNITGIISASVIKLLRIFNKNNSQILKFSIHFYYLISLIISECFFNIIG